MKKLIAIILSAVLLFTSVLSASMFTVSADGEATEGLTDTVVMPKLVDDFGERIIGSVGMENIPKAMLSYSKDFNASLVKNNTGLPFTSLYKITGGTTDRIETNDVKVGVQGNSCAGYRGFMFYIEVPNISEYTYEYIVEDAVVDPDTKEVITPAVTEKKTSSKFHMSLRADIYDTSDNRLEQFYIYAGNMTIWTLANDGVTWKENSMTGYGMTFDSGFKGFVYVPYTNLNQTGYIAEDDIFYGYSIVSLTASNDYYQNSKAKNPLHGYIPAGQNLVLSAPIQVIGAMDTNVSGDVDTNGNPVINGKDNILPATDVVVIGGEKYSYKRGKVVDYSTLTYPNVTSAFTAVNDFGSVTKAANMREANILLPESAYSHTLAATRTFAQGDTMESETVNTTYYFGQTVPLSFSGGWVVYVDFSELTKADGTGAEEVFTAWVRGAKEDGSTAATAGIVYASASDKTAPYYYLAEGSSAWVSKTLIDNDTATATYNSTEASDALILPNGFKGYVYFPNKLMRSNMTYNSGKTFKLMSFTVFDTDSVKKNYTISAPMYAASFDSTSIYAKGAEGQLVNLSTNTLVDPVASAYNVADKFPYDKDLLNLGGEVMSLTTLTDATRNDKNTISSSATFEAYTANGYTGALVANNTVFKDSLVRVTGTESSTQTGADMLAINYTSFTAADHDGYMMYIRNDSETPLHLAFQPYAVKADGKYNYAQINGAIPFLTQVDGEWQWTTKSRVATYTYELAAGEGGFFFFSIASVLPTDGVSYKYGKIRTAYAQTHPTTDVNFVASAPILVDNFTQNFAGMAYVNGGEVPQDLYDGEFKVPNDYNNDFAVNLTDLVQAKKEASETDFTAFRANYLNTYFNDAEYNVLSASFSVAPLAYNREDASTILSSNPDRGYRSEMVLYFASDPLKISETPDYTPQLLSGTGYTVDVSANAIYDSDIANGKREPETETDYNISTTPSNDRYPFGNGSGGAVHTVTVETLQAWINAHNNYVQDRVNAKDGAYRASYKLIQASEETLDNFYSRAAVHLVSNYMTYEIKRSDMFVGELTKVVYLNDDQKKQVVYTGAWTDRYFTIDGVERYIRVEGNAASKNFFYYDNAGCRVYNDDGSLKELKIHVYHDPRTIFASDTTAEWDSRLGTYFKQYKIGYNDVDAKTYYTRKVTYADGTSETIEIVNNLFNAYLTFTEFAHSDELPAGVLDALDYFFKYCAKVGAKANFRPSYNTFTQNAYLRQDVVGYQQFRNNVASQCADEETMIAHIKQMAPVVAANKDAIHNISSGWIGFGGEMAAGFQYPPVSYKNVITALLDYHCIPNGLYFSSRSSSYVTNIINGVEAVEGYNSGNLDLLYGLEADAEWTEKYAKWCGFNNDAFFGEQNFTDWGSGDYYKVGNESYAYDTANAAYTPNDGELYTNGSHVPTSLVVRDGKYVWVGFNDLESGNVDKYNDTDNNIPTPMEAILELAHHRYTDFSQWHGFLDVSTPNVMTFWMDHNAQWIFEGDIDSVEGNNALFNAEERAAEITKPITKADLEANGILYDPAYFANTDTVNAYEFIRDHLGYRLVAQDVNVNYNESKSDKVNVTVNLKNYGFGAAFNMESTLAIFDAEGNLVQQIKAGDPSTWYNLAPDYYTTKRNSSAQGDALIHSVSAGFDSLKDGTYYVGIKLANSAGTTVRFANDVEVNELGYNMLGYFNFGRLTSEPTVKETLKVMSYNIRCLRGGETGDGLKDPMTEVQKNDTIAKFRQLLSAEKPDVMIVCENRMYFDGTYTGDTGTQNVYEILFKDFFPYAYSLTTGASAPRIYSKYPLSNVEWLVVDYDGTNTQNRRPLAASIEVEGETIYIVACHPAADAAVYESDRVPFFKAVAEYAADKENVIIAGDLNTDSENYTAELDIFRDSFAFGNFGEFGNYETYRYGSKESDKYLDNILVKGLEMKNFWVGTETYSDHFPIYSEIYLTQEQ